MKWFPGSITDAVTASKQREAIFVVFVEGKDETSIEAASVLNSDEISSRLDRDDVVAIRIESDAESYNFFKQIYQVVPVPSLFFIGTNGVPIKVIDNDFSRDILSTRLNEILAKHEKKDSSSSLIRAEQDINMTTTRSLTEPVAGNSEKSVSSVEKLENKTEDKKREIPNEEKLERAKQLIELQRRQKIEKEREDERKREIERRKTAKDLQTAKQKQYELEVKLALDERAQEKAAEADAKARVRRQIEQDKLERKQRELDQQQEVSKQRQQNQQPSPEIQSSPSTGNDSTIARIQFRLPSGSPHMGKFEATSTLGSLRSYVVRNIELPFQKFTMSTTFPRRDLTIEDDDKTLNELNLVPTAVILILPMKNSKVTTVVTSSEDVGFVSRFVWALFAPVLTIYNMVVGYFADPPDGQTGTTRINDNGFATSDGGNASTENPENFGRVLGQSSGTTSRNLLGGPSTMIRSRGNIHRLHSGGDDNDENNTWNGNSTQQM